MAKLFKIKKKGLRYAFSAFVLLIMIIAVVGMAFGICFGIGYGLDATGTDWWNKFVINNDDKNMVSMLLAGVETLVILYILCAISYGFVCGTKKISNRWFNSVNNKKEKTA